LSVHTYRGLKSQMGKQYRNMYQYHACIGVICIVAVYHIYVSSNCIQNYYTFYIDKEKGGQN